jgi:cytochrome c-type biogenesis protein CcmH
MRSGGRFLARLAAGLVVLAAGIAMAAADSTVEQQRAARLAGELRCLVCQNQSVAESSAAFAVDLRRQIEERVAAGDDDNTILAYLASRYGDFVLYRPRFDARTALLWLGPFLLLAAGLWLFGRSLSAHRRLAEMPLRSEPVAETREAAAGPRSLS